MPRAHSGASRAHIARRDRGGRRLDPVRALHGARALRAGPRLLRGRRDQVRRRGRFRHRAGDDAALRARARGAGRGDPRRGAGAARSSSWAPAAAGSPPICSPRSPRATRCRRATRSSSSSPDLRERQRATIARDARRASRARHVARRAAARDRRRAHRQRGARRDSRRTSSRGAAAHGTSAASTLGRRAAAHFAWAERPADRAPRCARGGALSAEGDYLSEINPAAEALVEDVGRRLARGAALFIDYGFPAAEYYHPQRSEGTLMCHYRHRAHDDPFALARADRHHRARRFHGDGRGGRARRARRRRLRGAGAVPAGLRNSRCARGDRRAGVGRLHPRRGAGAEAARAGRDGRAFKVLALARSDSIAWPGFAHRDRSHRL